MSCRFWAQDAQASSELVSLVSWVLVPISRRSIWPFECLLTLTKHPRPRAALYGRSFPPCSSKNFLGGGQRVEGAAEAVVAPQLPSGGSLHLSVPLGNPGIFNKEGEFSPRLSFPCSHGRFGTDCVRGERGRCQGAAAGLESVGHPRTPSSWHTAERCAPPVLPCPRKIQLRENSARGKVSSRFSLGCFNSS